MPTTSWGLRYPVSGNSPNVPQDIQNLANDVQSLVAPGFASVSARNAAFPSPRTNQVAIVNGVVHTYFSGAWHFVLHGGGTYSTSAAGIAQIAHGGGQTPQRFHGMLGPQSTEIKNQVTNIQGFFADSTNINFRINRTDSLAVLASDTVALDWWAWF